MNKFLYSISCFIAVVVISMCLTSCGDDEDDFVNNGEPNGKPTLVIDGEPYYYGELCSVDQTKRNGMYLTITAVENLMWQYPAHELTVHISPNTVADLRVGDIFKSGNLTIRDFRNVFHISLSAYSWSLMEGDITVTNITPYELTIRINNMRLKHETSGAEHTISGIAVLDSGTYYNGNLLPFAECIGSW